MFLFLFEFFSNQFQEKKIDSIGLKLSRSDFFAIDVINSVPL